MVPFEIKVKFDQQKWYLLISEINPLSKKNKPPFICWWRIQGANMEPIEFNAKFDQQNSTFWNSIGDSRQQVNFVIQPEIVSNMYLFKFNPR